MKMPHIDLEKLKKQKEENFQDRLKFIDKYVEWMKKRPIKSGVLNRKTS